MTLVCIVVAITGISLMILLTGRHKVKCRLTDGKKSREGAFAIFAVSFAVGFLVLMLTYETEWRRVIIISVAGALIGAATELFLPERI